MPRLLYQTQGVGRFLMSEVPLYRFPVNPGWWQSAKLKTTKIPFPQPSTLNPQPSTLNPQPSILNPKP